MTHIHFVIYEALDGFRWRLKAQNGKIIADSGEAYSQRRGAARAVKRLKYIISFHSVGVVHKGRA